MASFTDTFDIADALLHASGYWTTFNDAGAVDDAASIEVFSKYATNVGTTAAVGIATNTVPTTKPQEAAAWCTSTAESANNYVDLGIGGDWTDLGLAAATNIADWNASVYVRLHWQSDGVRTLSIRHKLRGGTATEAATVDLVLAGSIEAEGYEGRLKEAGATGALQLLRITVEADTHGMFVKAFVNQPDDDKPTLTARILSDFVTPTTSATDYGAWWFGFGGAAARSLVATWFYGSDYAPEDDRIPQEVRDDQPTLQELRERVKSRYERGSNTNLGDIEVDRAVIDAVEQVLLEIGDMAYFMRRTESVSITPDSNQKATMPVYMDRVLDMRLVSSDERIPYQFLYHTTDGALVLRVRGPNTSYLVTYTLRHTQMEDDLDVCPIPRKHLECVVLGACMRLAESDRKGQMAAWYLQNYVHHMRLLSKEQWRHGDQERRTWGPRRTGNRYSNPRLSLPVDWSS